MSSAALAKEPQVAVPRFVEEAQAAGIDHTYAGSWEYYVGGGVAAFDCDDDARPDLYIAGGSEPAALYRNESSIGGPLAFGAVDDEVVELADVTGAYPIDIDADTITDLFVLRRGENVLLRGAGDCRFERANERWGLDGGDDWSVAFSAKWEPGLDLPTLAVGDYLTIEEPGVIPSCAVSVLHRGSDVGTYGSADPMDPGYCALSMLFSDWDRSGRSDLRITNDRQYYSDGQDQLWRVEPGKPAAQFTRKEGWEPLKVWGMGIASHDLTGDGYPEYYLTSMGDNKLQTLSGDADQPKYKDIAHKTRASVPRPFAGGDPLPSTAWHAEFDDVNNDGLMDIFVTKGNVEAMPDHAEHDPNNLLLGRPNGRFKEAAADADILNYERSRGAAVVDLNLDGLLDLVEVNRLAGVTLRRNVGRGDEQRARPMGHWLAVELSQSGPNRDAIGAWVEVRTADRAAQRELTIGGGHAGGTLGPVHFGLGDDTVADVRVHWPDGVTGEWMRVDADRYVHITRDDALTEWDPPDV